MNMHKPDICAVCGSAQEILHTRVDFSTEISTTVNMQVAADYYFSR